MAHTRHNTPVIVGIRIAVPKQYARGLWSHFFGIVWSDIHNVWMTDDDEKDTVQWESEVNCLMKRSASPP